MRSSSIFKEYVWLLSLIKRNGKISFADISHRWEHSSLNETGLPMSRTTFNRHRLAIEEIFDVVTVCDKSDGYKYHIKSNSPLEDSSIVNWMCDSLSMGTMMSDFKSLSNRIALEPVPTADHRLRMLLEAMSANRAVDVIYHRIASEQKRYELWPFAVKLFKQRWYLLASAGENLPPQIFSLERIDDISMTDKAIEIPEDFDVNQYFEDNFGVMTARDIEVENVIIRVFGRDQFYLEELPMHHSQEMIRRTDIYTDYQLTLRPSPDLAAAILSRGGWVQVLAPEWFAQDLYDRAGFMLESFETEFE